MDAPSFTLTRSDNSVYTLRLGGRFETMAMGAIWRNLRDIQIPPKSSLTIFLNDVPYLDTGGAYALLEFTRGLKKQFISFEFKGLSKNQQCLFDAVQVHQNILKESPLTTSDPLFVPWPTKIFAKIGEKSLIPIHSVLLFLSFWGEVTIALLALVRRHKEIRGRAILNGIYDVGVTAMPIVGLISFLMGIVLVYQGADQLRRFGAEIFTVDLLAISVLREIGVLLTAIVVSGRSASAYTAGLGFMKLNQEIDALSVLGLNPMTTLVIPRILSLVIALPLLVFFADMMALLGGALISTILIDLSIYDFIHHLRLAIKPWSFWVGMIKAPIFGYFIALIACFEGMRLAGGAEDVGRHTTKSVVQGIFLVIVLDAAFSIFFSAVGV